MGIYVVLMVNIVMHMLLFFTPPTMGWFLLIDLAVVGLTSTHLITARAGREPMAALTAVLLMISVFATIRSPMHHVTMMVTYVLFFDLFHSDHDRVSHL
jgi:hypothetical protein